MELNALNRIITDNPKYSKEIDEKIKIMSEYIKLQNNEKLNLKCKK